MFSGAGGFSLGLERAGFKTIGFCEKDTFARSVLTKNWPDVPVHKDIIKLNGKPYHNVFLICGGFPCQDISVANPEGKGLDGTNSSLWFEFERIIKEAKPKYVIIENSPNLRSKGLGTVLKNLWALGYDAEWHVIPASAFGALHQRARLWVIAYARSQGIQRPLIDSNALPLASQPEKPCFTDTGLSKWFAEWIRGRVTKRGYAVSSEVARSAVKLYGNSLIPDIPQFIGEQVLKRDKEVYEKSLSSRW